MAEHPVQNQLQTPFENVHKPQVNFRHSFRPVYIVSRIFGQMPFTIAYNANGEIQRAIVNKLDGVWFACSLSVFIYMIFSAYEFFFMGPNSIHEIEVSFVGMFSIISISMIIGALGLILDFCNRSTFVDILKKTAIFDETVNSNLKAWNVIFLLFVEFKLKLLFKFEC